MKLSALAECLPRMWASAFRVQLCVFALILPIEAMAAERDSRVIEKLRKTISELRTAGAKLTDADFNPLKVEHPADAVAAAGPEYVAAWREYRRAMSFRTKSDAQPVGEQRKKATTGREEYQRLLGELLKGDKPPTPEQLAQSYFSDDSLSEYVRDVFAADHGRAFVLACLQHRRFGDVVRIVMLTGDDDGIFPALLTALGFEWRKVFAGGWLDGNSWMLKSICKDAFEETAQLVVRYAERHWDEAVAQREKERRTRVYGKVISPQMPAIELLHLLKSDNSVALATKEHLASFLNANATRLFDSRVWLLKLARMPRGTVKWLKPMVHAALKHEKNEVRSLAERILHEDGETDVKAELRPPPRFRLFVDGQAWPDFVKGLLREGEMGGFRPNLGLSVDYLPGGEFSGLATSPGSNRESLIEPDADAFIPPERVRRAHFYSFPDSYSGPQPWNPEAPWIRAEIPLPPAFGQTTDVRIETGAVTIQPRFTQPARNYDKAVIFVEFGYSEDERSMPIVCTYRLEGSGPLVLSRVQPGEYLLRVRAPGAAFMVREKVTVGPKATRFEPKLAIGSSATVPFQWPNGVQVAALDQGIADQFRLHSWAQESAIFTILRDGKPFTIPEPFATFRKGGRLLQLNGLHLPNLPTGKYLIRLHSNEEIRRRLNLSPKSDSPAADWKEAEVAFEITVESPVEFTAPALDIHAAH